MVKGKVLTFQVSGKLWKRSLVMDDLETKTLWSHILGEAMRGKLKGAVLESIPSTMTDWKSWKKDHPNSSVVNMSRTAGPGRRLNFNNEYYKKFGWNKFVIGYANGGKTRAWRYPDLKKQPVVNDKFGKKYLLVTFHQKNGASYVFDRTVDGTPLKFVFEKGKLLDESSRSVWNMATGKCESGSMKGKQLQPQTGMISFAKAWENFHPESTYWSVNRKSR